MRGDPRCPDGESKWELWYHDLFDRDSVSKGAEGTGILEGLALLWRKEAVEGIFDDGSPTFSTFSIKWGNHSVAETADVYRDPLMNPGLRNIRLWRSEELFDEVATAHLRVLEKSKRWEKRSINFGEESKTILEVAAASEDVEAFRRALKKL